MCFCLFFSFYVSIICTSSVALQYLTRHKKLNPITFQLPWFLPGPALKRSHLHQISSDQVISFFFPLPQYKPHVYFCHVCNAPLTSYQLRPPQALSGTDPIQMDISLEGEQANPSWCSSTQGHIALFYARFLFLLFLFFFKYTFTGWLRYLMLVLRASWRQ